MSEYIGRSKTPKQCKDHLYDLREYYNGDYANLIK